MTERQALKAAKRRGLLNGAEVQAVIPKRYRRTCPACGETFLPMTVNHRGFCCACCAFEWGERLDRSALDRRAGAGVEVVVLASGVVGVIERVESSEAAIVRAADGELLSVGSKDVERIQYLAVEHRGDCRRKQGAVLAARLGPRSGLKGGGDGRADAV